MMSVPEFLIMAVVVSIFGWVMRTLLKYIERLHKAFDREDRRKDDEDDWRRDREDVPPICPLPTGEGDSFAMDRFLAGIEEEYRRSRAPEEELVNS